MEQEGEREGIPIVGPVVGQLLYQLARVAGSKRILEFGTAIGYSTSWLARAAKQNRGKVTSVELYPGLVNRANENIKEQGLISHVKIVQGDAVQVARNLKGRFDLVFIDADKTDYTALLDESMRLTRKGGIILADNTLWSGRVATDDRSDATQALRRFNEKILSQTTLDSLIIPIRDGVTFAVRR
jgi:predicted O-methyltransferase YrrM